jgi:response regulator RpfG family c-di-GMP phosphodiesterase/putative methionine-R-sulfoxide reductase with GAF domain
MMARVNVLMIEDQESDAELILAALRRAGFDPVWRRVTSEAEYLEVLSGEAGGPRPDVILADFNLPQFTGIRALELLRQRGEDIPFILVSGTIGEDTAVESIKLGATDYLLKDRLARLGPAIRQALEQKDLRDLKERQRRHQDALDAVIVATSREDDLDSLLRMILDRTLAALGLTVGAIWFDSRSVSAGIPDGIADRLDHTTRDAGLEQSLGDVVVEDWGDVGPSDVAGVYAPIAAEGGIRAILAVPILSANRRVGAVAVCSPAPRRWTADETSLVRSVARELGTASERRWAQARILRQLENLKTLYASAKKLSESLDLGGLTDYVVRTAVNALGVVAASVRRALPDGSLVALATHPDTFTYPQRVRMRWNDAGGMAVPVGRALQTGTSSIRNDIRTADDLPADRREALEREGIRATASLPLISQGKPFGVLSLYSDQTGFFKPGRVEQFEAFANLVAAALENARLFDDARRRLDELQALRDIDTAISGSLDARVTLSIFLDKVTTHLQVDAADILLLNPGSQTLEYLTGRGFRTSALQNTRLRLGSGHAGQAALERRTISVPNLAGAAGRFDRSPLLTDEQFVSYFAVPLIAKGQTHGVLEVFHRQPLAPDDEWLDFLSTLAGQAAIAIDSTRLFDNLQRANMELTMAYDTTLEGWSKALDLRDRETEGHTQRVTEVTVRLARAVGISDDTLVHVRRGALLHDIGKMGIPDSILLKPGPLTEDEWEIMRRHPVYAHELLSPITYLRPALAIPYAHHEKWDGTGYPRGLKGDEIPLEARVFAVVDVWDALTSDRPYRPAWPKDKARGFIREQAGTHFDPRVADMFLNLIAELNPYS